MRIFPSASIKTAAILALLGIGGVNALPRAHAQMVVVPGGVAATEGNSGNAFPFGISQSPFNLPSQRYQQVYGASAFGAVPAGGLLITQIAFRPEAVFGDPFSATLPSIQINLSTTSAAPDALSTTFASNVGANDTVVFSGPLALSSADTGPAAGPKDFDILINLSTPFLYDPAVGNLLLDVRNFGGGTTTFFDSEDTTGDAVSRVGTEGAAGVNSPTASFVDSLGLVTRFTFGAAPTAAIPEPGTLSLLLVGTLTTGAGLLHRGACAPRRRRA